MRDSMTKPKDGGGQEYRIGWIIPFTHYIGAYAEPRAWINHEDKMRYWRGRHCSQ